MTSLSLNSACGQSLCPRAILVVAVVATMAIVRPGNVFAVVPACGSVITTTITLTGDVSCTSTALGATALMFGANSITINLNGHTISGPFSPGTGSVGINVEGFSNDVIACRGGRIKGFDVGIGIPGPGGSNTVRDCHLLDNTQTPGIGEAIVITSGSSSNKILNNMLANNTCLGIFIDNGGNNQIIGNSITGANTPPSVTAGCSTDNGGAAIELHLAGGTVITRNRLKDNTNGIVSDGFSSPGTITGNDISGNLQDGTALNGGVTITSNRVDANGRDGIAVGEETFTITSNEAMSNGRFGIAVGGARGAPAGSNNTTSGNRALDNASLDLFWDGNGTGNTWTNNVCRTQSGTITTPCL